MKERGQWKRLKRWYYKRNAISKAQILDPDFKLKGFDSMQFLTDVKIDKAQLRDGVREMMHLAAFQHFTAKPKNWPPRGLTPEELKKEFEDRYEHGDGITDEGGEHEGFRKGIAVLTKTVLTDREAYINSASTQFVGKTNKRFKQVDVDKA